MLFVALVIPENVTFTMAENVGIVGREGGMINYGIIESGTFDCTVLHYGSIFDGVFKERIANHGNITAATLRAY